MFSVPTVTRAVKGLARELCPRTRNLPCMDASWHTGGFLAPVFTDSRSVRPRRKAQAVRTRWVT